MRAARTIVLPLAIAIIAVALAIDVLYSTVPLGVDFHTYEAAAQVGLRQGWVHIYDQALVADEQRRLVPDQLTQAFLSPPTVAWAAAALAALPYWWAYYLWAALCVAAFTGALIWASTSRGLARWVAVAAALAPWWVLYAVHLGQVVPLVAASVVVSWRLAREDRSVAAGLVLSLVWLKPNTAFMVPLALLAAGRYRTFATWLAASALIFGAALLTLGAHGTQAYSSQLTGQLPSGAAWLTVEGAFGVTGAAALVLRAFTAGIALASAAMLRGSPGLVVVAGVLGSLLTAPYLHAADLCLLAAAAWILWEEHPVVAWRGPLAAAWLAGSPLAATTGLAPTLSRWAWIELAMLAALAVKGGLTLRRSRLGSASARPLTAEAEMRTQGPA